MRYEPRAGADLHDANPPYFSTPEGGAIVTDDGLAALWRFAGGRTHEEVVRHFHRDEHVGGVIDEALMCLSVAGLFERQPDQRAVADMPCADGPAVTAIVVVTSARELEFLDPCVQSIAASTHRPLDLLIVDNESGAPLESRVQEHMPSARVLALRPRRCLAAAANAAIAACSSPYLLLMNPDVRLASDTVARLARRAIQGSRAAAVVPKTRLWRTPAFINAIGNRATPANWGTDNGIGQLDVGQFDDWREAPSASLTIELIAREAFAAVGPFDERYPAYYEDADWAYRARLQGWTIAAEPAALAFHIFGGFWDAPPDGGLSARKLATAVIGRLRFAYKIASAPLLETLLGSYLLEDWRNAAGAFRQRDWQKCRAYVSAWTGALAATPGLFSERRRIQSARVVGDDALFPPEAGMPLSFTDRNAPVLTSTLVRDYYAPLLRQRAAASHDRHQ